MACGDGGGGERAWQSARQCDTHTLTLSRTCTHASIGEWWSAIVIKSEGGKMLVHYDGGTAEEDEWIDPVTEGARIKDVVEAVQVCCTASNHTLMHRT